MPIFLHSALPQEETSAADRGITAQFTPVQADAFRQIIAQLGFYPHRTLHSSMDQEQPQSSHP